MLIQNLQLFYYRGYALSTIVRVSVSVCLSSVAPHNVSKRKRRQRQREGGKGRGREAKAEGGREGGREGERNHKR